MTKENDEPSSEGRRNFLRQSALTAGGGLLLASGLVPTMASGATDAIAQQLLAMGPATPTPNSWNATKDNVKGPFHRPLAPFRAMISPPLAEGIVTVINGRVYGIDTRQPLAGAIIDIWQADHHGSYDNDDPSDHGDPNLFLYRARLVADETGYYEYQTIRPGRYLNGAQYRPAHIHYLVRHPGYTDLITQLYFAGDPYNGVDPFIRKSLIVSMSDVTVSSGKYEKGTFDIILDKP